MGEKNGEDVKAFLGKGAVFHGKLLFSESVRIDGDFHGEISGEGTLVVGETAEIKADIVVNSMAVSGRVTGKLEVKNRVEIFASGKVYGDLVTPTLVIREGGVFKGSIVMGDEPGDTG